MTITEFLLARIAEDEAVARGQDPLNRGRPWAHYHHASRFNGPRILAECEAKRRIVQSAATAGVDFWMDQPAAPAAEASMIATLRALASVYADHPDYDEAWRP